MSKLHASDNPSLITLTITTPVLVKAKVLEALKNEISLINTLLKKKGPRGVRFEGCYSPGSVMATHKGVELTSWGVGRLC